MPKTDFELEYIDTAHFLTKENFSGIIEGYVRDENLNHFEAVIAFCEENNKEFEDVIRLFTPTMMEKVKDASRDMGLMPPEPKIEGL